MRTKKLVILGLLIVLTLAFATTAYAGVTKYTFNDVDIDATIVEIEASVKTVKKGDYSTCSYYSDDYIDYLGYYEDDVLAGETAEEVLAFCVDHFDERTQ